MKDTDTLFCGFVSPLAFTNSVVPELVSTYGPW